MAWCFLVNGFYRWGGGKPLSLFCWVNKMTITRANMTKQMQNMPKKKMVKAYSYGGKVKKMKHGGGTCRGMGAATKGGKYSRA